MKLNFISIFLLILSFNLFASVQNGGEEKSQVATKSKMELLNDLSGSAYLPKMEWTGRKITATILSALVPGSGQTYLGEHIKGVFITLAFYGTAVTAIISHNNFLAREDRINMLTRSYLQENEYIKADQIWLEIKDEENNRKFDDQRRKMFAYSAMGVWIINMIDVVFLSEDKGGDVFSLNGFGIPAEMGLAFEGSYTGIALQFNLP